MERIAFTLKSIMSAKHTNCHMAPEVTCAYLFHEGASYPVLEAWTKRHPGSRVARLIDRFARRLRNRRNVRSQGYMEALAARQFPEFTTAQLHFDADHLPVCSRLILLWPDANGIGWSGIEGHLMNQFRHTELIVLNGRRRQFHLRRCPTARSFRFRRFLEKAMVYEIGFSIVFLFLTPCMLVWDGLRGRR